MVKGKASAAQTAAAAASAAVAALGAERSLDLGESDVPRGTSEEELIEDVLGGLKHLEGAEEARWRVYCAAPIKNRGYIDELRTDQLTPEHFREHYGPGVYRVAGFAASGQYVKGASAKIVVSPLAEERAAPAAAQPAEGDFFTRYLIDQERRDRDRAASRKELALALGGPLITALTTMLAGIFNRKPEIDTVALIAALRPGQSNLAELTGALANLDQLRGGGTDQLETLFGILERVQDLPAGKGDDGWASVIKELAPVLADLRKARAERQGRPPQPPQGSPPRQLPPGAARPPAGAASSVKSETSSGSSPSSPPATGPAVPSPVPTAADSQSSSARNPMLDRVLPWLRRQAMNVEDWAASDLEPADCAGMLYDSVPRPMRAVITLEQLRGFIARPDWWEQLVQFYPALMPHKDWVTEGHAALLAMIDEDIAEGAARVREMNGAQHEPAAAAASVEPPAALPVKSDS